MAEKLTFEESLEKLENIVEKLESGSCSLEESIELFKTGVDLSKQCSDELGKAKKAVAKLTTIDEIDS